MDTLHRLASAGGADDDDKKLRRREQNRLSAQRSYHKKQERLSALRAQVSQLEATYERHVTAIPPASPASSLLTIPSASAASSPASGSEDDVADAKSHAVSPSSPPAPPGHLQQLLASRAQLQSENDALRRRLEDHARFQFRMQSLAAGDDAASPDVTVVHNPVTGSPRFQPRMQMKRPLSVDECYAMGSNGYQYMSKYRFPANYMTTGTQMCGWSDKRVLENGLLTVELRKIFRGHAVENIARTAWLAVKDPRKMDALYSLNMNMHSEIVQHIDDNNVVMYQSFETPERDARGRETGAVVVMHHVMLLTMFASENGYVIIFCSLDPDRLDESDHIVDLAEEEEAAARGVVKRRRKQWFKKFSWLTFHRVGDADDAFELSYLFTVPPHHGANFYWPLEIMLLMLRFEIAAVGPVILLPSSGPECVEEQSLFEELKNEDERLVGEDDDAVVMIENKAVKIEPLTLGVGGVDAAVDADDDMSELFIELFP